MSTCSPETRCGDSPPGGPDGPSRGRGARDERRSNRRDLGRPRADLPRRIALAAVLAAALAYVEASVVVYLRRIIAPIRQLHLPDSVDEMVPLLTIQQLRAAGAQYERLLAVEVVREISPIVVLLAMAWALRRRKGETAAFFMLGFGVWDIFYYVFLKVLLDWPASLGTWDVLYLIPTAWVAPVWAPLGVSVTLVAAAVAIFLHAGKLRRGSGSIAAWLLVAAGVVLVLTSFFLRTADAFEGVPERFDWAWFLCGWLLAVGGLAWMLWPQPAARAEV